MSIRRWNPYDELTSLRESMESLFDGFFTRRPHRALTPALWEPAVELYETDGELVMRAEMPGIDPKSVEVHVSGETLIVKAEVKAEEEQKGRNYHRRELRHGAFQRRMRLPTPVQAGLAKATFKNGILEVRVPKAEEAKALTVKVEVAA